MLDYVNQIFNQKSFYLKEIYAVLFLDAHASEESTFEVHDIQYIQELKGFTDTLDLNQTLRPFNSRYYFDETISSIIHKNEKNFLTLYLI